MNRFTRNNIEPTVSYDTAMRLREEGIETPAEMYYKIYTPTGEHSLIEREVILHAWGTRGVPEDEFVPAPTRREVEDYLDYSGLIISDELLEEIQCEI